MRLIFQAGPGPEWMWTQMHFALAPAKVISQSAASSTAAKTTGGQMRKEEEVRRIQQTKKQR